MTEQAPAPTYRFRGHVQPSAEVSRPAAAYRNAAKVGDSAAATSATLDIFDVIDSYGGWWGISARDVDAALKLVGDIDTLYVRVNSPGGEATEGVAIANLLRAHPASVRVTVYGLAASAASMIAVAGDVVNMAPGSMLMIHDAVDFAYGPADQFRKSADVLDAVSDSYAGLYALKAGGAASKWRTAMRDSTWYSADGAVAAKLADQVGIDPALPDSLPPVEDDVEDEATVIEIDVQINPAARAAARRFDLSMLPNAPAALAPQTPAEPPAVPSTDPKEADTMSDTILIELRKQLGLPDDADEATVLAANAEALTERADPPADPPAAVPDGHVVIDGDALEELRIAAKAGQEARSIQLRQDRDQTISAAITAGHIAPARRDHWAAKWDADPEGVRASIAELTKGDPIYPVADLPGYTGAPGVSDEDALFTSFFPAEQKVEA